ncbi:hypothetical protein COU59_02910 [Candidatus Pacearchaeota archaeon CG10_big_fil_rev_8_21_14_0_10_34_12]|nr:MAG: hypothetical protein COU59_02910 [Candidatus Pacearchaeota archaeon CG10_big_fil_rev_8_21_14_0_10_34_12]
MEGDYEIADIYQGGYSSLSPEYGPLFTGYRANINKIGQATSPFTTNILQEVSEKLRPGQKVIEVSMGIFPDRAPIEAIPKQHLDEVKRQAKLAGVDITVHGPLLDASGFAGREGFDEQEREIAELKIIQALEKGYQVSPGANVPVTFHSANSVPGARWRKISDEERKERGIKENQEIMMMPIVNQETGQLGIVKKEEKFYPGHNLEKGEIYTVEKQLSAHNNTLWDEELQRLIMPKEHADRILMETYPLVKEIYPKILGKEIDVDKDLTFEQRQVFSRFSNAHEQLRDIETHLNSTFNKGYKYGDGKMKEYLKKVSEDFSKKTIIEHEGKKYHNPDPLIHSRALQDLMQSLRIENLHEKNIHTPEVFKPAEEYALEKSKQTFGNAAFRSYEEFGNKAPIISIENPPAGFGLSRAEDIKNLVEGSREQFVKKATEKMGMSKKQAEIEAEKLIGATWDVGHINQLRKFGFSSKDIIKEAEKVAPYLKHVHLSDNFGLDNVELPMGMGNVDFKEVMKKLGKKGDEAKKIVESGHWWTTFKESPIAPTLQALGSSIYGMDMAPYWNQIGGQQGQGYFSYGMMLPQINYETFGAGFSNLPAELGGQRQGGQGGRMSGRGME